MKQLFFILLSFSFLPGLHAQVLYGTTSDGGSGINGKGTICKFLPATNTLTAAYSFNDPSPDGRSPLYADLVQGGDGKLYGTTYSGGNNNYGSIFSFDPATSTYTKLRDFDGINGANPGAGLVLGTDGKLYGTTTNGGANNYGTIYSFNPANATYNKLLDFSYTNGYYPYGSLVQATNGNLYGMTTLGGNSNFGVFFSFNPATAAYARLKDFDSTNGSSPFGSLMQATDGKLYGMTTYGGAKNAGIIFSYNIATATFAKLKDFDNTNGANPYGSFTQASDGKLYGMTYSGGNGKFGVIFSLNPANAIYTKLKSFDDLNGSSPYGSFKQAADGLFYATTNFGGSSDNGVLFSFNPATSAYTKLKAFNGTDGANPHGNLTQTSDGKMYGLTRNGGSLGVGVIFSFLPSTGVYNKIRIFGSVVNGANILGGVVKNAAGKLYGMFSTGGGTNGLGGIFSFDPATSVYAKLLDFDSTNGATPYGSLTLASNGKLYGMTYNGGTNGYGALFSFDPASATYTRLKDFDLTSGRNPRGNLLQAADGKLYGMTTFGGSSNAGVIFSFDPVTLTYSKLKDFDDANGGNPYGNLIQAGNGKLYGMTTFGGNSGAGVIFSFDINIATYTKLKDFTGTDGAYPNGSLTRASDGKLYGMTYSGGSSGAGVLFSFDPANAAYARVKDFDIANGRNPRGSVTQASDGKLYGMTQYGGMSNLGVVFSYNPATAVYSKLNDFTGTNGKYPLYTNFTEVSSPAVTLKINNVSVQEGNSGTQNATFNVTLSAASSQTVTVNYTTKNATASAPADYAAKTGTLTFAPGVKKQTIAVVVNGDMQVENNETFKFLLSNPVNAAFGDSIGVCTIVNDDAAFAPAVTSNTTRFFTVSPNPATSIATVQLHGYTGNITLQLLDMQGRLLKQNKTTACASFAQQQFDVSHIASGTYYIVAMDEQGKKHTQKLVVSH